MNEVPIIQSVLFKSPYSGCGKFSGWPKAPCVKAPGTVWPAQNRLQPLFCVDRYSKTYKAAPVPPGPPAVWGETPTGGINGINRSYTTAKPYTPSFLAVFLNGLRMRPGVDYIETGNQSFQFFDAPLLGDSLSIDYIQP
jgi:hypothetical protein